MPVIIERAVLDTFGTEAELAAAVSDFQAALAAHALTVNVPAPTAPWLVNEIVRKYGGDFTVEAPPEPEPEPEPIPEIPASYPLSNRQLRLGLIRHGIGLSAVAATIAAIADETARDEATVWWEYSDLIHWDHPMTQTLIGLMGIPLANAEAMWMVAKDYAA